MPTQSTYERPGHQSLIGPSWLASRFTIHSHVTLPAPTWRKIVTTCRQAATQVAAGTWR